MTKQLYCTAGAGMEELLANELRQKLHAAQVEQIPGRVFFSTNAEIQSLTQLRSAERLFLLLQRADSISLPNIPAQAITVIKQTFLRDPDIWRRTLSTWTALQKELHSPQHGRKRKREEESVAVDEWPQKPNTHMKVRHENEKELQDTPTFRVSCRCSGVVARSYSSQRLSRIIGIAIKEQLGWKVDLREPLLEVNVYVNDDHCIVGIPLLKHPLACRSYVKHNGLRSTIAWAMSSFCPEQLTDGVILDPMCGVGAVLLEAAQEYSNALLLGMDTDESQLQKAAENVKVSGMEGRVQLIKSSAMAIPLADGRVDAILCDVPFGRKFRCGSDMPTALPLLLREMERVLRVGGHLVLLLSLQLSVQLKKMIRPQRHERHPDSLGTGIQASNTLKDCSETPKSLIFNSLHVQKIHKVSLGSTDAFIHSYTKV